MAKTTNKDTILLLKKEYTIKSALDFLETWIKISGYPYRHEEANDCQNRHSYVIQLLVSPSNNPKNLDSQ